MCVRAPVRVCVLFIRNRSKHSKHTMDTAILFYLGLNFFSQTVTPEGVLSVRVHE